MSRWAENLERLRALRKLNKVAFAESAGVSPQQLGDLQKPTANPEMRTLQRLADGLGVDISELFRPLRPQAVSNGGPIEVIGVPLGGGGSEPFTHEDTELVAGLFKLFIVASVQAPRDNASAILLELAYALAITADPSPEGLAAAKDAIIDARDQRARRLFPPADTG